MNAEHQRNEEVGLPQTAETRGATSDSNRRPPSRSFRLIRFLLIFAVLGPVGYAEFPREMARWHIAASLNHQIDGELQRSTASLEEASRWDSAGEIVPFYRAQLASKQGQYEEAVTILRKLLEAEPDKEQILVPLAEALMRTGRTKEAVKIAADLLQRAQRSAWITRADASNREHQLLNLYAYYCAIADVNLEDALGDANRAVRIVDRLRLRLDPQGYLRFALGVQQWNAEHYEEAEIQLALAHGTAEALYQKYERRAKVAELDPRPFERSWTDKRDAMQLHLAEILFYEVQVNRKLNRSQQADQLQKQLQELTSAAQAESNLRLEMAQFRVLSLANVLDTRGFIYYRMGQHEKALLDLDDAVEMLSQLEVSYRWLIESHPAVADIRAVYSMQAQLKESRAVVAYHRGLIHQALGQNALADQDFARVRKLGFEPNEQLF